MYSSGKCLIADVCLDDTNKLPLAKVSQGSFFVSWLVGWLGWLVVVVTICLFLYEYTFNLIFFSVSRV
jgi:dolichyl-phosphate-mannose--protein O-mannosyl transferase